MYLSFAGKPLHMKKIACLIGACYSLYSCKPPSYSYVPATMNTTAYSRAGEGQLGFMFGSPGIGAKGGVAITKNISVNAWAGALPAGNDNYGSKEFEVSLGIQTNPQQEHHVTSFYIGHSGGSNEKKRTGLTGDFNRTFLQVQQSAIDARLGAARLDGFLGVQVNYLSYEGTKESAPFNDYLWYYQPYFGFAIGGNNVRFEILQGLAIKNTGEWSHGVRVFPWFGHVGMLVKIRNNK
ncbi:hypothetical protein A4R26_28260 [Niastella populi]|uniref:Uncharacterized protein n=2 Tax=Niastella populi TaxID=550983 RepID=A0A1V9F2Y4_9BACT|nr:hypothetical protein A4R26_28260 [Niastella populi]